MKNRTPILGAAAGAALLLAAPSGALAVTGAVDKPCYTHVPTAGSDPITVSLTGGTPGANFLIAATVPGKGTGSAGSASGVFDATGNGSAQITDVSPPSGTIGPTKGQVVNITAQDYGAGGVETPIGQATITNLALSFARKPTSPRKARVVSISGVPFANQKIYGFVVRGSSSKVLRKFSLGTANACGFATTKRGYLSPKTFRTGTYRLYVNAGPTLDKPKSIYQSYKIYRRYF